MLVSYILYSSTVYKNLLLIFLSFGHGLGKWIFLLPEWPEANIDSDGEFEGTSVRVQYLRSSVKYSSYFKSF